jgi:isovaleryl-CoA dehydrogenase
VYAKVSHDEAVCVRERESVMTSCCQVDNKISAFVVERSFPGFSTSKPINKCGMRGSSMAELFFENCVVPKRNLLGKEGQGVTHMMRNLEIERLALAAMSVGIAERCEWAAWERERDQEIYRHILLPLCLLLCLGVEIMVDYGKTRKAFGKPISDFGQIQRYIGDGYALMEAAKALTYNTARGVAPGTPPALLALPLSLSQLSLYLHC